MKKAICLSLGAFVFGLVAGCGSDNASAFVGHWIEVSKSDDHPMTLDISYSDNVFHIDEKKRLLGKDFDRKLEGHADSSTTLCAMGGALTMRLENNRLYYSGRELVKSP